MKTYHALFLGVCLLLLSACTVGGNISKLPVARQANGERVQILLKENWYVLGEFLALDNDSIFVLADILDRHLSNQFKKEVSLPAVAEISLEKIGSVRLVNMDHVIYRDGNFYPYKNIELRYFSRYPQSIDANILKGLLQSNQQDSLWVM